jgi:hypothetical protein
VTKCVYAVFFFIYGMKVVGASRKLRPDDRQPPNTNRPLGHRYQRASVERILNPRPNGLQQRRNRSCVETFPPDPYYGWTVFAAGSKQGMEIRIERYADARVGARSPENLCIIGTAHADFGNVQYVPAALAQQRGR